MFGRGSLNGGQLNDFSVNGGVFVENLGSAASVNPSAAGRSTRRLTMISASAIISGAVSALTARRRARGAAAVECRQSATAVLRRVFSIASQLVADGEMTVIRRVTVLSSAVTSMDGGAHLAWAYQHRADAERTMRIRDIRQIRIHADLRTSTVPRRPQQMVALCERGGRP